MRRTIAVLAGLLAVVACSSPAAAPRALAGPPAGTPASLPASARAAGTAPARPPATRPAAPPPPRVTVTRTRTADGSVVTVAAFSGPVTYVLHDGSEDPGYAAGRVRAGPVVRGAERGRLLAAFNGGFKLSAGAGGYEQEGHVASPLRPGLASLVIDRSGRARIGVWGHGVLRTVEEKRAAASQLRPDAGKVPSMSAGNPRNFSKRSSSTILNMA